MFRNMMSSKIHLATVTEANLHYIGSITIDENLMDAVGLIENEKVQVVDVNNGERLETYVITGPRDSGVICLNGAAARLVQVGDQVIIIAYKLVEEKELKKYSTNIAFVDKNNKITEIRNKEQPFTVHNV